MIEHPITAIVAIDAASRLDFDGAFIVAMRDIDREERFGAALYADENDGSVSNIVERSHEHTPCMGGVHPARCRAAATWKGIQLDTVRAHLEALGGRAGGGRVRTSQHGRMRV